ncbi:dnaJ homolog subfamily C member 22-like [Saccostrea echinata]|uniref:dnaJ homolog subfamily C member 22-like n=1 Tax=Saccostrea echinata TaxID=191078 RepID=UPI002A7F6C6C|nr:dnaJ homolog subfamily C member 22-like [Saccostrea echinata]
MAHIMIAYIFWLVGGWWGLHHFYLGRDRQAFIWWATFGGCFGLGWFRDLWRIPEYIFAANRDNGYLNEFEQKRQYYPYPKFNIVRFAGEIILGWTFGILTRLCVPEENAYEGLGLIFCIIVPPCAIALGVHVVANVQPVKASFQWPLIGALCGVPWILYDTANFIYSAVLSAIFVNWKGKQWNTEVGNNRPFCKRFISLCFCCLLYSTLWGVVIYQTASITTKDGEEVPLREAIPNFFNSPAWAEMKESLKELYKFYQIHGFEKLWEEFVEKLDPTGETNAYKVLNLSDTATEKEIKARYKILVREWHPDKQRDPSKKAEAQEKFMEIQRAYEILSKIQSRRMRQNVKARRKEEDQEWMDRRKFRKDEF